MFPWLPEPVEMQVSAENGSCVAHKPECIQHGQQIEESHISGIGKPRLDGDSIV